MYAFQGKITLYPKVLSSSLSRSIFLQPYGWRRLKSFFRVQEYLDQEIPSPKSVFLFAQLTFVYNKRCFTLSCNDSNFRRTQLVTVTIVTSGRITLFLSRSA